MSSASLKPFMLRFSDSARRLSRWRTDLFFWAAHFFSALISQRRRRVLGLAPVGLLLFPAFSWSLANSVANGQPPAIRPADADDVVVEGWDVGLQGAWRVGFWTEVQLRCRSPQGFSGQLVVEAPDGESAMVRFVDPSPVSLAAGEAVVLKRLIKIGRLDGQLRAIFSKDDVPVAESTVLLRDRPGLGSQRRVLLHVGDNELFGDPVLTSKLEFAIHAVEPSRLPQHWAALSAFDAIWVSLEDVAQLAGAQRDAIVQWNEMGGHLILCGLGSAVSRLGPGGEWQGLSPGEFTEVSERSFGGGVEQLANAKERLETFSAAIIQINDPNARALASLGSGVQSAPVIARAPRGFGIATLVGLQLGQAPFTSWDATDDLIMRLLESPGDTKSRQREGSGSVRYVGYDDLSGQLRSALDAFDDSGEAEQNQSGQPSGSVRLVSFSLVVFILVVYAALLGPGDYFLLRRFRAFEWTWLTFPLLVAVVVLGFVLLRERLKSNRVLVNQLDTVDIDMHSGAVRGTLWAQAYSPETSKWSIEAKVNPAMKLAASTSDAHMLFAWQGLPGDALGGMESRSTAGLLRDGYNVDLQQNLLAGVPMRTASTRSLGATWWGRQPQRRHSLKARDGVLEGDLESPLMVDLENCALFYGTRVHLFDGARLRAGEVVSVRDLPVRRDLAWRLNQKKLARASDTRYTTTPWNPEDRNLSRIVEMMMLYNAAGGEQYTRMKHQYQGVLDMSDQLELGRAVLIGRTNVTAAPLSIDGRAASGLQWAYYRIVFPVTATKRGDR